MSFQLPNPKEVRDMFEDLLGRPVTVNPGDPLLADALKKSLVSLYVDDKRQLVAVAGMDLALTAYAGAAIGLLPPGGAQDCVADGELTPMIMENVREVCNIMASLLNREGGGHCKVDRVFMPGEEAPLEATQVLLALGRRIDLTVEVGGYGSGKLAITTAA
jgi:hypothetical protein